MGREIEFRGMRKSDGTWLYGSLINNMFGYVEYGQQEHVIVDLAEYDYDCYQDLDNCDIEVKPETVGQFTGLTDKHGNKVFEGDILSNQKSSKSNYFVKFNVGGYDAVYKGNFTLCLHPVLHEFDGAEIIGNIHEHPDLL